MVFLKKFRKRHDEYSFEGENENLAGEPDQEAQQAVRADPEEGLALNPEAQSLTGGEEVEDVNIVGVKLLGYITKTTDEQIRFLQDIYKMILGVDQFSVKV